MKTLCFQGNGAASAAPFLFLGDALRLNSQPPLDGVL